MNFLRDNCKSSVITADVLKACQPFACGDSDMDEFFKQDVLDYAQYHMGKSYCFRLTNQPDKIVCAFTVSTDSIRISTMPRSRRDKMWSITHHQKRLRRFPGILIGRLAVAEEFAGRGIGSELLYIIKQMFLDPGLRAGCRFLIVDAKNDPAVLPFYEKNGFRILIPSALQEDLYINPPKNDEERLEREHNLRPLQTRLMYFDLLDLKDNIPSPPEVL